MKLQQNQGLKCLPRYADEPDIGCATPQGAERYRGVVAQAGKSLFPVLSWFLSASFCPSLHLDCVYLVLPIVALDSQVHFSNALNVSLDSSTEFNSFC